MKTYTIAEGITVELTNRTARLYEDYLRALDNLRLAQQNEDLDWYFLEEYFEELGRAEDRLFE